MVQLSKISAVAFLAATTSASPFGSFFKSEAIHKRLSSFWFQVYNYDPATTTNDGNQRTEQLFVELGKCTTLENMWDKETTYIVVGPGVTCGYYATEDCSFTATVADYIALRGWDTKPSAPINIREISNLKDTIGSYLCNEHVASPTTGAVVTPTAWPKE